MSFIHPRRIITALVLSVCSLSTMAQYSGGDGSGSVLTTLAPTTCPLTTYPAIFGGGQEDGYSLSGITQTSCSSVVMPAIFSGGNEDGYGLMGITQANCAPLVLPGIFAGGTEDGYSYAGITQSSCAPPTLPSIFAGGVSNTDNSIQLNAGCAPLANFSGDITHLCIGDTVHFSDLSMGSPTAWAWSFPGGNPASSGLQSPEVIYNTPGTYDVTLTVTSVFGTNSITLPDYITVGTPPAVSFSGLTSQCEDDAPITLTGGSPAGGVYSGNGVAGGVFDPASAGAGAHVLTYSYADISGCTNSDTSQIIVHPTYTFVTTETICNGDSYIWQGNTYTASGTYTQAYNTVYGCDSTFTLNLTVTPAYSFNESHIMCAGETYTWQGTTHSFPGTYTASYVTVNGCDSVFTLQLSLRPAYSYTQSHSMCTGDTYVWQGSTYSTPGIYNVNYGTINGCDSSYTLHLTVNPTYSYTESQTICNGDSYTWHGMTYTTTGTYTLQHYTVQGCDSTFTLNLTVYPQYAFSESHTICNGDSYIWHGNTYTTSGTYTLQYYTAHGCDSTYTLNLTVYPQYAFTENQTICNGDSYTWHGNTYTTGGTYTLQYYTGHGCDSTYTLNLTLRPAYAFTVNQSICLGDSYVWQGTAYSATGTYTAAYQTQWGCDSIFTLHLTVNPAYLIAEADTICDGDKITWQGNDYTSTGNYSAHYTTSQGCDSTYTLALTVNTVNVSLSVTDPIITATAGNAWQWLDCDNAFAPIGGAVSQSYTATANGNYAVIVTDGSCSDTSACVQILAVGMGSSSAQEIFVYPNPSNGHFMLTLDQHARVEMYNALGSLVFAESLDSGRHELTLTLADGVYMLRVADEQGTHELKLVIKK